MATANKIEHNLINAVNLCSMCLEQYKSPVILPCSHSFCLTCLAAHIKSSCVNLDPPLGFPCPLCRVFIPAPGRIGQYSLDLRPKKFPENKLLSSVIEDGLLYCKPCQRDAEVIADSWCQDCSEALCHTCEKYHKKLRPTCKHVVVSVTDLCVSSKKPYQQSLDICEAHYGQLTSNEHLKPVNVIPEKINLATVTIKTESGLKIPVIGTFYGGDFLSNGKLLLADNINEKFVLCEVDCGLTVLQEKKLSGSPYDVCAIGENEVLVTLPDEKKVLRLDSDSLEIKETISLECWCYGIATSGNITVIGTRDSMVMFSGGLEERRRTKISSDLSNTDDVALDNEDNLIYSSYSKNAVRKQDKAGNVLFSYTNEKLIKPFGLDVSRNGEIFVGGHDCNNIHILSRSGELLRILGGIKNPTWVKFQNDTNRLFVMESENLKVFQFTGP
ncbi:uncharacterized protein LOC111129747 [Crassostrea virginica]